MIEWIEVADHAFGRRDQLAWLIRVPHPVDQVSNSCLEGIQEHHTAARAGAQLSLDRVGADRVSIKVLACTRELRAESSDTPSLEQPATS
jgi:hypothetical protein